MSTIEAEKRPLVWVFTGMASQWPQMGKDLLNIPIFKETIERCHKILQLKDLDLFNIITTDNTNIFENILNSFVGIGSMQIALINILKELGMEPDYIIGHSFGEVACGYADGCLTEEEALLCAYYRGLVSLQGAKIVGRMGVVALGYDSIKSKLPSDIDVACHNAPDSCTIAGPKESIEQFVAEMKSQGIPATIVETSNMAFHSRYIEHLGPKLLSFLKDAVVDPKKRSSKWLSSSVPPEKWGSYESGFCSGEYYTNNLCSSVFFEEAMRHIPKNSICLEISPHGLLQPALESSVPNGLIFAVAKRKEFEGINFFLNTLKE